jgi:myo-inositol 2-dehydrogenase / D-chiro-inositol 1-dehydrogenase
VTSIGIGLIGCGWISEIAHMPSLARIPNCRVTAIADKLDERRAVGMRIFPAAKTYSEAQQLLDDPEVDAVVIALPPSQNIHIAPSAFAARKHVYLEKPLASSLIDGNSIRKSWLDSKCVGMVGYNFRRHPAAESARALVLAGALGEVVTVHSVFTWQTDGVSGWRAEANSGGSAVFDLASHHIDLVQFLFDKPVTEISARLRSIRTVDDTVDMILANARGTRMSLHASSAAGRNRNSLMLMGTKGQLMIDLLDPVPRRVESGGAGTGRIGRVLAVLPELHPKRRFGVGLESSFHSAMRTFVDACISNRLHSPTLEDGYSALAVVDAALKSNASAGTTFTVAPIATAQNAVS